MIQEMPDGRKFHILIDTGHASARADRGGGKVRSFLNQRGFENSTVRFKNFLRLLSEDRQLNVDAGAFAVRPAAAPTTTACMGLDRGPGTCRRSSRTPPDAATC